ncbi:MAG: insulinase family protein [Bryobacteraceae bacterium]|nr:insulinase family protein [Bryobacteraceae bacterium]MDW8379798.1 pitrilysin family protein [Bryobacterales bacterium]
MNPSALRIAICLTVTLCGTAAAQMVPRGAKPAPAKSGAANLKAPVVARSASRTWRDLKFRPLKEIRLPEITSFTLANGLKVFLLEDHELPLVRGFAYVRTGNVFDPPEKTGLSDVFGDVLRTGGTKSRTGDELNELLEGMAASIESGVGETNGSIGFNTLSEHTDKVLNIFYEILTEPRFAQDKIEVIQSRLRSSIARRNDQAGAIAAREFERLVYGPETPWGRQMEYETLDRIGREDLLAFYDRYYFPSNIILAVYGDFVTSTMRVKLENLFSKWNVKRPAPPPVPPVTAKAKPGIYFAEKSDVNQTFFRMGHLGGKLSDKDYPALEVMADILGGGGFTSRLLQKVRSDLGYAYSISAGWNAEMDHPGTFVIGGSVKAENTVDALKVIREEVDKIRSAEVTDEELRIAKESTLNSFVFNFDTPAKTIQRLMRYEYYGYPKDFIFQYQKAIAAVTKVDVLRVAKQYIKPEEFVIVAVGPKDLGTALSTLNLPVNKLDISIPEPKPATAKADAQTLAAGKQLLAKLQRAVGGAERIASVKDYMHTANVTVQNVPGGLKVTQVTRILGPQIRLDQKLPFGTITVYSDGKGGGFLSGPQGTGPLPPQFAKQTQEEVFRNPISLWLSDRIADRQVNAAGPNLIEITDSQNNWARVELDASGLPTKLSYKSQDLSGPVENEGVYGDWREVDGIKLPHSMKVSQKGKVVAEISILEYKLNSGLKEEDLSKRP